MISKDVESYFYIRKHKLKNSTAYLAGPIQYVADAGVMWRENVIEYLHKMGIKVFNPINKPKPFVSEIKEEGKKVQQFIENNDFYAAHEFVKQDIVHVDLRMVDLSDFLIVYINPNFHTCGTYHELFHAWEQKKPVLVFIEGGRKKVPAWLLGIIKPKYIFNNITETMKYIDKLDKGEEPLDSKWVLFDEEAN